MKIAVFLFLLIFSIGNLQNVYVKISVGSGHKPVVDVGLFKYRLFTFDISKIVKSSSMEPKEAVKAVKKSRIISAFALKRLDVNCFAGVSNDACTTALLCSAICEALDSALTGYFDGEKSKYSVNVAPKYGKSVFFIGIYGIISISVPTLLTCFLRALLPWSDENERRQTSDNRQ